MNQELIDLINELKAAGITPTVTIHFGVGEPAPNPDPDPDPTPDRPPVIYKVDTTGKPNNRVKVRPTPGAEAHDYIFHGDVVGGSGKVLQNHAYITWKENGTVIPGYVELEYLVQQ